MANDLLVAILLSTSAECVLLGLRGLNMLDSTWVDAGSEPVSLA